MFLVHQDGEPGETKTGQHGGERRQLAAGLTLQSPTLTSITVCVSHELPTSSLGASGTKGVGPPFQADRQAGKPDLPSFPTLFAASGLFRFLRRLLIGCLQPFAVALDPYFAHMHRRR